MRPKAYALLVLFLTAGTTEAQESAQWEWTVAPYLWASDVGLDLTVNDETTIGGDAAFKDILDKVDTVFMGRLEAWINYLKP